jgi:hypothetical protein
VRDVHDREAGGHASTLCGLSNGGCPRLGQGVYTGARAAPLRPDSESHGRVDSVRASSTESPRGLQGISQSEHPSAARDDARGAHDDAHGAHDDARGAQGDDGGASVRP